MSKSDPVREMAEGCIAVRVRLLNRLVTGVCDAGLRGHGMSIAQVNILVAVGHTGALTPTELAAGLVMDKSTLSRDLPTLFAAGWLRKVGGNDKRSYKLELTDTGRQKVAAILPAWRTAQTELRARLGGDNLLGIFSAADLIWAEQKS